MDRIGHVLRLFVEALLVLLLMLGCVRLCTGCTLVVDSAPKERVAEIVRAAYAEGNAPKKTPRVFAGEVAEGNGEAARKGPRRDAVSNRIEKLVVTGDLSRKQADRLHALAQGLYDRVLEKLEDSDVEACLDCKD